MTSVILLDLLTVNPIAAYILERQIDSPNKIYCLPLNKINNQLSKPGHLLLNSNYWITFGDNANAFNQTRNENCADIIKFELPTTNNNLFSSFLS